MMLCVSSILKIISVITVSMNVCFIRSIGNHGLWNLNPAIFKCVHRCFLIIRTIALCCQSMLEITELLCFCVFH